MNKNKFTALCRTGKGYVDFGEYSDLVTAEDYFDTLVDFIRTNTILMAKKFGLDKTKKEPVAGNEKEEKWRAFFRDNSFDSTNQMRLFAEVISMLEGIEALTFLNISRTRTPDVRFPAFVCIVPMDNSNSHNYKIGEPIINIEKGTKFYRALGTSGNTMSSALEDYRIASEDEITMCLLSLMYRNPDLAGYIIGEIIQEDE
jgi:hypothetical protein